MIKVIILDFAYLPRPPMKWKCLDCKAVFDGPRDRPPPEGCAVCASVHVFDINVEPLLPP